VNRARDVSTAFTVVRDHPRRRSQIALFFDREASLGVVLMIPGALLLMVFMAYPFALGIWLSLTDSMVGRFGRYVGLRNFVDLLEDSIFLQTAKNTVVYALVTGAVKG
jgi:multiple sugar transport system permease protein